MYTKWVGNLWRKFLALKFENIFHAFERKGFALAVDGSQVRYVNIKGFEYASSMLR